MILFYEVEETVRAFLATVPKHVTIPEVLKGIGLGNMMECRGTRTNIGRAMRKSGWHVVGQLPAPDRQRVYIRKGS